MGSWSGGMTYLRLVAETKQLPAVGSVNPRKTVFGVPEKFTFSKTRSRNFNRVGYKSIAN